MSFHQLKNGFLVRGTPLPIEFKQQVKEAVAVDDLLDALDNPLYCNWLNIRLLKRIVKTLNIEEAQHLIQAYEKCVYSKKVSDVKQHFKSVFFKPSHISVIKAKIMESPENLTVADIIRYCEILEYDMGLYSGSVTAIECNRGCLQMTCVIPIHCALVAYETAKTNFLNFRQCHIQYIEIESFPKVFALNFSIQESLVKLLTSGRLMYKLHAFYITHSYVYN